MINKRLKVRMTEIRRYVGRGGKAPPSFSRLIANVQPPASNPIEITSNIEKLDHDTLSKHGECCDDGKLSELLLL